MDGNYQGRYELLPDAVIRSNDAIKSNKHLRHFGFESFRKDLVPLRANK